MGETLGDVIINLRSKDVNMTAGLNSVREGIDHLTNKVFSFEGALHIAFGAAASRAIFHELHGGIKELIEGFDEGKKHGEDFYGSLNEGINKVLGLKTAFEQAGEAAKQLTEKNDKVKRAVDEIAKLTGTQEKGPYPDLPGGGESGEKNLATMTAERDKLEQVVVDAIKKADENEKARQFKMTHGPMAGVIANDPVQQGLMAAQRQADQSAIKAARAEEQEMDAKIAAEKITLAEGEGEAAKKKAKEVLSEWEKNVKDTIHKFGEPFEKAFGKLGEGLHKETEKAEKKNQHEADERYRRNFEYHKKLGEQAKEKEKHDDESAKRIRDSTDPAAKLKDEFAEIARLVGIGKLSPQEAQKAREKDAKEFNQQNRKDNQVQFRSADVAANDMLSKSLEAANLQKEANDLLKNIEANTKKPQPAAMV
jgi:hypothetical protein